MAELQVITDEESERLILMLACNGPVNEAEAGVALSAMNYHKSMATMFGMVLQGQLGIAIVNGDVSFSKLTQDERRERHWRLAELRKSRT